MKRENYTTKNNSLFLNKTSMETKIMEIKVTKTYKVGNQEFTSKNEAFKATARVVLEQHYNEGIEALIENAAEVRRALGILSSKE